MASLTEQLLRLVRGKPVTPADRRRAALLVLDTLANALAARETGPGRILRRWAARQGGDAGRRAFLLGGLAHTLEMDDLHRASVTHPGCVVVPAALALAESEGRRGHALLDAVLQGYEAVARIGMAAGPAHYRLWHATATCGPFGAAMAAAALLRLDDAEAVHALGNAGTQAAGLWEFLATGAMSKPLHAGRAAEAGLLAAQLAAEGFTGPPRILEGPQGFFAAACPDADPAALLRDPAAPWQLHATSLKPWPACRHTHPAIDAALGLRERLAGRAPVQLRLETYATAIAVCDRPAPESAYAAKFSLQHCIAAALADGRVDFDSFEPVARARHAGLRARIQLAAAAPFDSAYPAAWGARLMAQLADGSAVAVERQACLGDPERPLDEAAIRAKAAMLLCFGTLDRAASEALVATTLALADDGPLPSLPREEGDRRPRRIGGG